MVPPLRKGKTVLLPYLPPLTNEIATVLKLSNLKPIYYPCLQVGRLLSNGMATTSPLSKCGVYLLGCRDCPAIHIGECKRAFRFRIDDHVDAFFDNEPTKSPFAKHLLTHSHSADEERLLHYESKYKKRLAL